VYSLIVLKRSLEDMRRTFHNKIEQVYDQIVKYWF